MLDEKFNFALCISKTDDEAICEFEFASFYFLITYRVCKKRKYYNRMSEKKKFSPFDECSCFVYVRK